jgi:hypothetical protein
MSAPKCHGRRDLDMLPASDETQAPRGLAGFGWPGYPKQSHVSYHCASTTPWVGPPLHW